MSSRVVVTEHRTRAAARISKNKWRRRRERAVAGSPKAIGACHKANVPLEGGALHVAHSTGREDQKWSVFFEHTPRSIQRPIG